MITLVIVLALWLTAGAFGQAIYVADSTREFPYFPRPYLTVLVLLGPAIFLSSLMMHEGPWEFRWKGLDNVTRYGFFVSEHGSRLYTYEQFLVAYGTGREAKRLRREAKRREKDDFDMKVGKMANLGKQASGRYRRISDTESGLR